MSAETGDGGESRTGEEDHGGESRERCHSANRHWPEGREGGAVEIEILNCWKQRERARDQIIETRNGGRRENSRARGFKLLGGLGLGCLGPRLGPNIFYIAKLVIKNKILGPYRFWALGGRPGCPGPGPALPLVQLVHHTCKLS